MASIFQNPKFISNQSLHQSSTINNNDHEAMIMETKSIHEIIVGEKKCHIDDNEHHSSQINVVPTHNLTPNSSDTSLTP